MFLFRRVVGESMSPTLQTGQIIVGHRRIKRLQSGDVVVLYHEGLEKIKRIAYVSEDRVFVVGDNREHSIDSRHFGEVLKSAIIAKVCWPIH